ncbi:ABC transporter permease [Candidatus Neptunochlamydia vexilliferae]|uniref:Spermidine/putrescine transport system permease protein PotB n=1 Tax=Candidatus Neptunichlamydia vexilliferae TaxID=1651774 RepID=A0ABS0AZQ0_9BACT|nr:ABC transporter permease [Candidatus Neptunochlamydia vexilliferae]MBF5059609.1 Spermidine/putrescine transport system permease protein PotB [Candidatus Neptunochlamydia vexilliferae]
MYALFSKIQQRTRQESSFAIGSPALIWQIIFFYLPLLLMMGSSLFVLMDGGTVRLSFENFAPLFSTAHLSVIFSSISLALCTALISLSIAYPLAHFIAFKGGRYKTLMLFFLIVPFWTNFLLHVYAWFFVLEREGFLNTALKSVGVIQEPIHFLNSIFAVILMMVYCYLPFMVLPIFSSLERFDRRLLEASNDLGASWKETFQKVMLPLTLPAVRAGFFLVFIPAFGEFIIPELMGGDKRYFVGNVISQYVLGKETGGMGAAFMVLSCFSLMGTVMLVYFSFKKVSKVLLRGLK